MEPKRLSPPKQSMVDLRSLIERRLQELLPLPQQGENLLAHAMHTGVLAPGKRTRSMLMLLTAKSLDGDLKVVLDLACAVEMVHAASLFLDDMPCMDNAQLRRGRLAAHLQYGEDIAVLASIALLSEACLVITNIENLPAYVRSRLVAALSCAVGRQGLANGQYLDLRGAAAKQSEEGIASLNKQKTGVLFAAALDMAAMASQADDHCRAELRAAAIDIGQAFQMRDDLEDGSPTVGMALKDRHKDQGKTTLVSLLGRETVKAKMLEHLRDAVAHLQAAIPRDPHLRDFVLQAFNVSSDEIESVSEPNLLHANHRNTYSAHQGALR